MALEVQGVLGVPRLACPVEQAAPQNMAEAHRETARRLARPAEQVAPQNLPVARMAAAGAATSRGLWETTLGQQRC